MKDWIDRRFELSARGTTVRTEVVGGVTTFATMAYILIVQPIVLSAAGMDAGAVLTATCIASAIGCTLMALLANYPIALAPAMGHNFFFTYAVVLGEGVPWPTALGAIAASPLAMASRGQRKASSPQSSSVPRSTSSRCSATGSSLAYLRSALTSMVWEVPLPRITIPCPR